MKLGLGTVQFGIDYGATNKTGKISNKMSKKIINLAINNDVQVLDTSPAYGDAETILGEIITQNDGFRLVTKTLSTNNVNEITEDDFLRIDKGFHGSLENLGVKHVYGLLVHDSDVFFKENITLFTDYLTEIKNSGLAEKIGVSIYTKEQLKKVLECFVPDIIQVPVNVFDKRFFDEETLSLFRNNNIEVHARSVFLQGVLLAKPENLNSKYYFLSRAVECFQKEALLNGLSPLEACLSSVKAHDDIDEVIIGVSSQEEFKKIIDAWNHVEAKEISISSSLLNDPKIIDPRFWPN